MPCSGRCHSLPDLLESILCHSTTMILLLIHFDCFWKFLPTDADPDGTEPPLMGDLGNSAIPVLILRAAPCYNSAHSVPDDGVLYSHLFCLPGGGRHYHYHSCLRLGGWVEGRMLSHGGVLPFYLGTLPGGMPAGWSGSAWSHGLGACLGATYLLGAWALLHGACLGPWACLPPILPRTFWHLPIPGRRPSSWAVQTPSDSAWVPCLWVPSSGCRLPGRRILAVATLACFSHAWVPA